MKSILLLSCVCLFAVSCKQNQNKQADATNAKINSNKTKSSSQNSKPSTDSKKGAKKVKGQPGNSKSSTAKAPLLSTKIALVGFSKKNLLFYDVTGKMVKKTPINETEGELFSKPEVNKTWFLANSKLYLIDSSRGTFKLLYSFPKQFNKCLKKGALAYAKPEVTQYYRLDNFGLSKNGKGVCMSLDSYKLKTTVFGYAPFNSSKMVFTTIKDKSKKCTDVVGKQPCEIITLSDQESIANPYAEIPDDKCYIKFNKSKKKIKLKKNDGECDWQEVGLSHDKKHAVYAGQTQSYAGSASKDIKVVDLIKKKVIYDNFQITASEGLEWSPSYDLFVYYDSDEELFKMVILGKKIKEIKTTDQVVLVK
jgi:hypothetical protein